MRQLRDGVVCLFICLVTTTVVARAEARRPWHCESTHFSLHTDLPPDRAARYLARMEATLHFAARYWGRPSPRRIECYLIDDLNNWRDQDLPHTLARVIIRGIGGITVSQPCRAGSQNSWQALIYASTAEGVVEHEVMHAYCSQNFGATGPEWYKEGMAELASFGETGTDGVRCPPQRLKGLRSAPPRSTSEIRATNPSTRRLSRSLEKMLAAHRSRTGAIPLRAWTAADAAEVQEIRDEYLWSWALCHFLHHNPNYRDRFRLVGDAYVSGGRDSFEQTFAPMASELMFEFAQFLTHVEPGYRVDLCHWEWHRRFMSLERVPAITVRCRAARGWQPAELLVRQAETYSFQLEGGWSTGAEQPLGLPQHAPAGQGRLIGVVLHEFQLGEPFVLGAEGRFIAPQTGKLYVRCEEDWSQLADNRGEVQICFRGPRPQQILTTTASAAP